MVTCATSYTINVWRSSISENTASHVVHVVVRIGGRLGSPTVGARVVFKRVSELAACCVGHASAHGVKLAVSREKDTRHAGSGTGHAWSSRPTARSRCSGWCRRRALASTLEAEFADTRAPVETAVCSVVFAHGPEAHVIGGIDGGHAIIAPASIGAYLASCASEHDRFPLTEVIGRIGGQTAGITNARE